jgi:GNAT superfamily N-acetyltransferase
MPNNPQFFLDYYLKGVLLYAKAIEYNSFHYYEDVFQRTKYTHNFLLIDKPLVDPNILKTYIDLTTPYGFTQFMTLNEVDNALFDQFFIGKEVTIETYQWLRLDLTDSIVTPSALKHPVKRLDQTTLKAFLEFNYQNDRAYGEVYALENGVRTNTILLNHPHVGYFLVMDGDTILGQIGFLQYDTVLEIDDFIVKESHRYQGIGTSLYQHVFKYALSHHIQTILLISDPSSEAYIMYQKWGFKLGPTYRCHRIMHHSVKDIL